MITGSSKETETIKKNFNFNNVDLQSQFDIENSNRQSNSKTLNNFHNISKDPLQENHLENADENANIMITLKTESDELNQSNDLKEKINELNLSMRLKKSSSLNFVDGKKEMLKSKFFE